MKPRVRENIIPVTDVADVLRRYPLTRWEDLTGLSRPHLRNIREGRRFVTPFEWSRIALAVLHPDRAAEIAKAPREPIERFEEERFARRLSKAEFAAQLGMSKKGYENASLHVKGIGSGPQRALAWVRAGYDWRRYALMRAYEIAREITQRELRNEQQPQANEPSE
jgi:hypothetical protein